MVEVGSGCLLRFSSSVLRAEAVCHDGVHAAVRADLLRRDATEHHYLQGRLSRVTLKRLVCHGPNGGFLWLIVLNPLGVNTGYVDNRG